MTGRVAAVGMTLALLLTACASQDGPPAVRTGPAAPTGLTASPGNTSIVLKWTASSSSAVAKYNVYQGSSSSDLTEVAEVAGGDVLYRVNGLANGTEYYFAVDAENGDGELSEKSNVVSATPSATAPPSVVITNPDDGAVGVGLNSNISVTFSASMNEAATAGAFSISPAIPCAFSWSADSTRLSCDPDADFAANQPYTVTIGTGATDTGGTAIAAESSFDFTTGTSVASACVFGEGKFNACVFGP